MTFGPLILKRASASRLSGECNDDDYDVLVDGVASSAASSRPLLAPVRIVDAYLSAITRTHADAGYEATREAAMAAFAKSWAGGRNI
jgi:hypothetical protein